MHLYVNSILLLYDGDEETYTFLHFFVLLDLL